MLRDILTRQVLISGQITDAITGAKPRNLPQITVQRAADNAPVPHVTTRVMAGGQYLLHGDPAFALAPPQDIGIRIIVTAQGYTQAEQVVALTAADLARVDQALNVDGDVVTASVINGVPVVQNFALAPTPVTLKGRVSRAEDPTTPIVDADVQITAPAALGPVQTDADGFYTLGPAPVDATITLSITAAGRDPLNTDVRLDFRQPINQGGFALEPS